MLPATKRQQAIPSRHVITRCAALWILALGFLSAGQTVKAQVVEGKFYRIMNVGSKKCLALGDDAKTVEGAQIVQRMKGNSPREQWSFVKQGNVYKIINRENGQALNVQGASTDEGAPIIQLRCNGLLDQGLA